MTWSKINCIRKICRHCGDTFTLPNIQKHEKTCYKNPINRINCPVCGVAIKNYKTAKTCSKSCAKEYVKNDFVREEHADICFKYHGSKCVVCDRNEDINVHYFDTDFENSSPENLIPLCQNHHQDMFKVHKNQTQEVVDNYRENYIIESQNTKAVGL